MFIEAQEAGKNILKAKTFVARKLLVYYFDTPTWQFSIKKTSFR